MESELVKRNRKNISVLELRRLLHSIKDLRPDICVRFRIIGELWQTNHLRVIQVTDNGVFLQDERLHKFILVPDLKAIMQFELDHTFQQYQPHFHYDVDLND